MASEGLIVEGREGDAGREREEGLQRIRPCCQGHIVFGRSNKVSSMECGPGESSAAGAKKHAFTH